MEGRECEEVIKKLTFLRLFGLLEEIKVHFLETWSHFFLLLIIDSQILMHTTWKIQKHQPDILSGCKHYFNVLDNNINHILELHLIV
jgi:hypothetical protein